ncbi:hypothetical protein SAMN05444166_4113 [Singulisphaera sp. GP187]|uniref:hypothetical protein n=1 Tax=Singulisphaera sp. GP187 TaxID=1882752 RepID=UPI00092B56DA|nr:hypothetical protein [Singulisphaera sp. GP187]SIO36381.1 hypothetical protein SAMN05444166_4113 [Singulisphaera sp. GP187]
MGGQNETRIEGGVGTVALYHNVYRNEGFEEAALTLFKLVQDAQVKSPNQRRTLFLDIEGHRNEQGGFDSDMFELQQEFLIGFLSQFLSEIHCPLVAITNPKGQKNEIPDRLDIRARVEQEPMGEA